MPSPLTKDKLPATATKRPATATKRTPSSKAPSRVKRGGLYDDTFARYERMMDVEFERIKKDTPQVIEDIKKNNTHEVKTAFGFKYEVNEEEAHKELHALLHKNVSQKMTKDDLIKINVHNFSGRVSYVFKRRI